MATDEDPDANPFALTTTAVHDLAVYRASLDKMQIRLHTSPSSSPVSTRVLTLERMNHTLQTFAAQADTLTKEWQQQAMIWHKHAVTFHSKLTANQRLLAIVNRDAREDRDSFKALVGYLPKELRESSTVMRLKEGQDEVTDGEKGEESVEELGYLDFVDIMAARVEKAREAENEAVEVGRGLKKDVERFEKELADVRREVQRLRSAHTDQGAHRSDIVNKHLQTIQDRDAEVSQLKTDISTKDEAILARSATVQDHKDTIAEREQTIRTQTSTIETLNEKLKHDIYTKDRVIDAHSGTIRDHKDTIAEHEQTIRIQTSTMENLGVKIATLQKAMQAHEATFLGRSTTTHSTAISTLHKLYTYTKHALRFYMQQSHLWTPDNLMDQEQVNWKQYNRLFVFLRTLTNPTSGILHNSGAEVKQYISDSCRCGDDADKFWNEFALEYSDAMVDPQEPEDEDEDWYRSWRGMKMELEAEAESKGVRALETWYADRVGSGGGKEGEGF